MSTVIPAFQSASHAEQQKQIKTTLPFIATARELWEDESSLSIPSADLALLGWFQCEIFLSSNVSFLESCEMTGLLGCLFVSQKKRSY